MGYYGDFDFDIVIEATKLADAEKALATSERFGKEFAKNYSSKIDEFLNAYWHDIDAEFDKPSNPLTALAGAASDGPDRDPRGDLVLEGFTSQKWRSYARDMFAILAPFVKAGSLVEIKGEEGERVRWEFDGERMIVDLAVIMFSHELGPLRNAEDGLRSIAEYIEEHGGFGDIRQKIKDYRPDMLSGRPVVSESR